MILDRSDRQGYQIPKAIQLIRKNLQGKENKILEAFEDFVLRTENLSKDGERGLNERDVGLIGSSESGLRALNNYDNNDIRGVLLFVQEWESRNGLRKQDEAKQ